MRYSLLLAAAGLCGSIGVASANCRVQPFRFFPSQNDRVTATAVTDDGVCVARFGAGGALSFTNAEIVSKPSSGTVTKTGSFEFRYAAKKGYKGSDAFTIKLCGQGYAGAGCSQITYNMTVR